MALSERKKTRIMNKPIRIGGVPEHFNLPIHLGIEDGSFRKRGIELEWRDFQGGTGAMTQAMREGTCDLCVLLTEGIIADIYKGNPSKIISVYVKTPLCWGIHSGAENSLSTHKDIYNKQYAISRKGSGSHLMAIIDANSRGLEIQSDQWNVIGNLDGALAALSKKEADVFYWEKFTTKPYVDNGQLKRVGEFYSPWPCFVIAATDEILEERPEDVIRILRVIHDECDRFMQDSSAIDLVSRRYHQKKEDVARWYHSTEWAIHGWISDKMIDGVIYHLQTADILQGMEPAKDLIWKREE